jgi:hypothetical protein
MAAERLDAITNSTNIGEKAALVDNFALAEATLKQKPRLLTKRMFKVGLRQGRQRLGFGSYLTTAVTALCIYCSSNTKLMHQWLRWIAQTAIRNIVTTLASI